MTNKDKKSHDESCCNHGDKGEKSTCAPMSIKTFNEELKAESPEFFKKIHNPSENREEFTSEEQFLSELHKKAPKLYEKLKSCNFKFRLDDNTKNEWKSLINQVDEVAQKTAELEDACKSKKC
jgi:hypothetical protein